MHALSTVIEKASAHNLMGSGVLNLLQSQVVSSLSTRITVGGFFFFFNVPITLGVNAKVLFYPFHLIITC